MKDPTNCLKCKVSFRGQKIPKEHQKDFGKAKWFSKEIALYDLIADRTYAFKCFNCGNIRER